MASLGEQLKKGRENKNISLEDVADAIKINKKILEDLENDYHDFSLPPVYIKGFIRSYCRYIGLDEKKLLNLYEETCGKKRVEEFQKKVKSKNKIDYNKLVPLIVSLIVLISLLCYIFFIKNLKGEKLVPESQRNAKKITPDVSPPEVQPLKGKQLNTETPPTVEKKISGDQKSFPSSNTVKIEVKARARTWMKVTTDNNPAFEVTLFQGDEVSWEGKKKIELKVGNAGGVKMDVNGLPLKPFGRSGEVVELVFEGNTVSIGGGQPQDFEMWQEQGNN